MKKSAKSSARYVDGFVLVVPKKNIDAYKRMAQKGAVVWRDHGALEYRECIGDDMNIKWAVPFPKIMKAKPGETIVLSWIVYKSRKDRDKINAKVMKDPRLAKMMDPAKMPFDFKRMVFGGFNILVNG